MNASETRLKEQSRCAPRRVLVSGSDAARAALRVGILQKEEKMIHAGKLSSSARLQATLRVLSDCHAHSTRDIAETTGSQAVHTDIAELRANGLPVGPAVYAGRSQEGRKIYCYTMDNDDAREATRGERL